MDELPTINTIATGHGPLLSHHVEELTKRYRTWSQKQAKPETVIGIFYVSEYGYGDRLAQAIANGISKTNVGVEIVDLGAEVDLQELRELVGRCAGLVVGMPPASSTANTQAAFSTILGSAKEKQGIGIFETGGGDDEPIDPLLSKFRNLGLATVFPAIRIKQTPTENIYKLCEEAGTDLGQWVTRDRSIKNMKSLGADLDRALGRICGDHWAVYSTVYAGRVSDPDALTAVHHRKVGNHY
jgi:flavorubredoxin